MTVLAISVSAPNSPSKVDKQDKQGFQNLDSQKIAAPAKKKQYIHVLLSSMSVVVQAASEYSYSKGAEVSHTRE